MLQCYKTTVRSTSLRYGCRFAPQVSQDVGQSLGGDEDIKLGGVGCVAVDEVTNLGIV